MKGSNNLISEIGMEGFNEKNYRDLIENLPSPVYICDTEGFITLYNKAAAELWAYKPKPGKDKWCGFFKMYKTNGTPLALDSGPVAQMLKQGQLKEKKIIGERADGELFFLESHPYLIFNESGTRLGVVNVFLNITEQKKIPKESAENQLLFKTISNSTPVGLWIADSTGKCNFVNETWMQWTGLKFDECMGRGWLQKVADEDKESIRILFQKAINNKDYFKAEFRIHLREGSFRWCYTEGYPFSDAEGNFMGYTGSVTDISEKKSEQVQLEKLIEERTKTLRQSNTELKKSEERYHKMIEEVQDYAIILLDIKGTILNWNNGARKIKGYSEKEVIGKNFRIFYLPEDIESCLPEKLISLAVESGRAESEGWRRRKDGTAFWGSIVITALHDDKNNIIGFSKVTRDLTERKKAEDTMKQYLVELEGKNTELEQFAYVSSHDLQEPLRKIRTFSDLLETQITDQDQKRYLSKINSSAERMTNLIKDLLNYSRLKKQNEEFVSVDLNKILEDVKMDLELVIEQKQAVIKSNDLPQIKGIRIQFNQLFTNLLNNSLKFNVANPVITIEASPATVYETVALKLDPKWSYFKLVFSDNGIGFESHYSEQIFTIFQRLNTRQKFSGTGIGLAMCKKIIDNHNGYITARGEPDKGAVFTIYLPER